MRYPSRHGLGRTDQHQSQAVLQEFPEQLRQFHPASGIHAQKRIVEDQHFRMRQECPSNPRSPGLAVREFDERERQSIRDAESLAHFDDLGFRCVRAAAEVLFQGQRFVGIGELEPLLVVVPGVVEEPRVLLEGDVANDLGRICGRFCFGRARLLPSHRITARQEPRPPEKPRPPETSALQKWPREGTRRHRVLAEQRFRERGLARTDRAGDGPGFTLAECPREIVKHDMAAAGHGDAIENDERGSHGVGPASSSAAPSAINIAASSWPTASGVSAAPLWVATTRRRPSRVSTAPRIVRMPSRM